MVLTHRICMLHSIVCLFLIFIVCPSTAEIHRAKAIKTKQGGAPGGQLPRFPPGAFSDFDEEVKLSDSDGDLDINLTSSFLGHSSETWIYSLVSAALVGLSGIFPLIVIPLETGRNLHHGAPAARLKLLLSFAVGGLLGDVFLHLLPEAWSHLHKAPDLHRGHMHIGLWVMTGLFSFLIIEKIFPDGDESDQDEATEKVVEQTKVIDSTPEQNTPNTRLRAKLRKKEHGSANGSANGIANGVANGVANGIFKNGHVKNEDVVHSNDAVNKVKEEKEETKIKTSGWLNLMANVIDNFTHGLAVAGSFAVSHKTGFITTVAVLLHEVPHEIGDFAILLQSGFDRWKAAKAQLLTASGGLLGAVAALASESAEIAGDRTAWILPFTSGGFIYIALVTVVPNLLKETNKWESAKQVVCLLSGIVMVAGVTLLME